LGHLNGAAPARITWRPYQLNPTMPKDGMDRTTYLEAKFGSLDAFRQMEEHVLAAGAAERIPFAFEKVVRTPNTFLAHRLIWYAEQQGCQDAVVESLFRGYFTEGADIGSVPVLGQLAGRAGLDADAIESFLHSEEGTTVVKAEEAAGHRIGIRGVPYFVINGSISISGAQPPDIFVSAIQQTQKTVVEERKGRDGSPSLRM
jgi:predicted DsbA family dithiol-disulfide isomerase